MSQSQPVIPVTMQYGGEGYGGRVGHELHHIEREVHRTGDHLHRDINSSERNTIATINALANADQAQTRSSQIETRQAVERNADQLADEGNRNSDYTNAGVNRNADYINNNVKDASVSGLLQTQQSAVAGVLATQQAAVATALAVQNTSAAIVDHIDGSRRDITTLLGAGLASLGVQNEKNAAFTNQMVLTQAQSVLLGQKDAEVNASNNRAAIQLQNADYKAAASLQASEYHKDSQLLAQQNFQATQLQAANYSSLGLLKTTENAVANPKWVLLLHKLLLCKTVIITKLLSNKVK